ncbi:MAG: hypothetical protein IKN38_10645, partial [Clostridia bacterium]|nr:hypothetical protein [Clostridia bacterium]
MPEQLTVAQAIAQKRSVIASQGASLDAAIAAIARKAAGEGTKPSYLISDGDTVGELYFNTSLSSAEIKSFLSELSFDETDENNADLAYSYLGLGELYAYELSEIGYTGEYMITWNEGEYPLILYCTTDVAGINLNEGWRVTSVTPENGIEVDFSGYDPAFVDAIDRFAAKESLCFGSSASSLPRLNAPSVSITQMTLTITNPASNGNFVTGYKILVDGAEFAVTQNTAYDLSGIQADTASVAAIAVGTNFADSAASTAAAFTKYFDIDLYDDDASTVLQTERVRLGSMPTYT